MKIILDFVRTYVQIILPIAGFGAVTFMIFGVVVFFTDWRRSVRIVVRIIVPLLVIAVAVLAAGRLIATRSQPKRAPIKNPATLVNVVVAKTGSHRVSVPAMATVTAARRVVIRPEVAGRIVEQCPQLLPGGLCKKGDVLATIDPRDYEFAMQQAQSEVDQAQSELALEQGRQTIAKREWELLGKEVPKSAASQGLALRKPQLAAARARLGAAESRLSFAKLNLERTTIRSPFNAVVAEENAEVGQLVDRATSLATLIGTDAFWLRASIPIGRLRLIALPGADGKGGSKVRVIQVTGDGDEAVRQGRVVRLLSDMDKRSRMARLLIEVDDPLALADGARTPLLADSRVQVEIEAAPMERVIEISRAALREGGRVWIMDANDQLEMRKVRVAWHAKDTVLVHIFDEKDGTGIRGDERIVTSLVSAPTPGMALRITDKDGK